MAAQRLAICVKDIMQITGKSYKRCWLLLKRTKAELNKPAKAIVTIEEFCQVQKLDFKKVSHHLTP